MMSAIIPTAPTGEVGNAVLSQRGQSHFYDGEWFVLFKYGVCSKMIAAMKVTLGYASETPQMPF